MADGALTVSIVGAGKAKGELEKIAGGYRAIGSAAKEAARSADKVNSPERQARGIGKVFQGTALGGLARTGGMGVEAAAMFGPWGVALAASAIALKTFTDSVSRAADAAANREVAKYEGKKLSSDWEKAQQDKAWSSFEKMSPLELADVKMQGGRNGKLIDNALKQREMEKKLEESNLYDRLDDAVTSRYESFRSPLQASINEQANKPNPEIIKALKQAESTFLYAVDKVTLQETAGEKATRLIDAQMQSQQALQKAADAVRMQVDRQAKAAGLP